MTEQVTEIEKVPLSGLNTLKAPERGELNGRRVIKIRNLLTNEIAKNEEEIRFCRGMQKLLPLVTGACLVCMAVCIVFSFVTQLPELVPVGILCALVGMGPVVGKLVYKMSEEHLVSSNKDYQSLLWESPYLDEKAVITEGWDEWKKEDVLRALKFLHRGDNSVDWKRILSKRLVDSGEGVRPDILTFE